MVRSLTTNVGLRTGCVRAAVCWVVSPSETGPGRGRGALGQRHVGLGLLERETVAEERNQALHPRPFLDGLVQYDLITEYNYLEFAWEYQKMIQ